MIWFGSFGSVRFGRREGVMSKLVGFGSIERGVLFSWDCFSSVDFSSESFRPPNFLAMFSPLRKVSVDFSRTGLNIELKNAD